jgi:hypothetical protein
LKIALFYQNIMAEGVTAFLVPGKHRSAPKLTAATTKKPFCHRAFLLSITPLKAEAPR